MSSIQNGEWLGQKSTELANDLDGTGEKEMGPVAVWFIANMPPRYFQMLSLYHGIRKKSKTAFKNAHVYF